MLFANLSLVVIASASLKVRVLEAKVLLSNRWMESGVTPRSLE